MRRFGVCVTVLMIAWCDSATGIAQMKITTGADYAKVMKATAQAFGGVINSVSARSFADAKANLPPLREGFVALEAFWEGKKRADAIEIVKRALTQVDALEKVLATEPVSRADALVAATEIQGACNACHTLYREGNNQTGFRFKAGVL